MPSAPSWNSTTETHLFGTFLAAMGIESNMALRTRLLKQFKPVQQSRNRCQELTVLLHILSGAERRSTQWATRLHTQTLNVKSNQFLQFTKPSFENDLSNDNFYRLIIFRSTHHFATSAKIWQLIFSWMVHLFTNFSINCFKFKIETKSPRNKIGAKFKCLKNKQSLEIGVNQWTIINKTDVSHYGWHMAKIWNNVPTINL